MEYIEYRVHSDIDENNIYQQFSGRGAKQKAIKYAKDNMCDMTYVNRVIISNGEAMTSDLVWCYAWE